MNEITEFEIVKMESDHIESLIELENLCFSIPWTAKMFMEDLLNEKAFYFVAVKDYKVIGYAGMWTVLDEGQITNIAVHPDFRKLGIGKRLLHILFQVSSEKSIIALTLEVRRGNLPAINLYKDAGFYQEGVRKGYYADNKEDAIIMWKKL